VKFRLLSKDYEISDSLKQQLLYGVAVLVSIISVFSIIFMFSYYSEDPTASALPSPGNSAFTQVMQQQDPNSQVAGIQKQNLQPPLSTGPDMPSPKPSPSPSPSASPSVLPSPSPSPSSTPTPTPTPTPASNNNPTPTPTPSPSTPANLQTSTSCDNGLKVILTWDPASYASSYKIYKNSDLIGSEPSGTSYNDLSVTAGTSYTYYLKSKNSTGESGNSDSKTVTPQACPSPSPTS
jgi:hypothetical protein